MLAVCSSFFAVLRDLLIGDAKHSITLFLVFMLACYAIAIEQMHYRETTSGIAAANTGPICSAMRGKETTELQVGLVKFWVETNTAPSKRGALLNACNDYRPSLGACMTDEAIKQSCFLVR